MAKTKYSADSALPQYPSPSRANKAEVFKTLDIPAPLLKDMWTAPVTFVVTGTTAYIGATADLRRRLQEHGSVRQKADQSGPCIPTPTSID